jgi:hypothetical protein
MRRVLAGLPGCPGQSPRKHGCTSKTTQIYEGTNQVQCIVMARNLPLGQKPTLVTKLSDPAGASPVWSGARHA